MFLFGIMFFNSSFIMAFVCLDDCPKCWWILSWNFDLSVNKMFLSDHIFLSDSVVEGCYKTH